MPVIREVRKVLRWLPLFLYEERYTRISSIPSLNYLEPDQDNLADGVLARLS